MYNICIWLFYVTILQFLANSSYTLLYLIFLYDDKNG